MMKAGREVSATDAQEEGVLGRQRTCSLLPAARGRALRGPMPVENELENERTVAMTVVLGRKRRALVRPWPIPGFA